MVPFHAVDVVYFRFRLFYSNLSSSFLYSRVFIIVAGNKSYTQRLETTLVGFDEPAAFPATLLHTKLIKAANIGKLRGFLPGLYLPERIDRWVSVQAEPLFDVRKVMFEDGAFHASVILFQYYTRPFFFYSCVHIFGGWQDGSNCGTLIDRGYTSAFERIVVRFVESSDIFPLVSDISTSFMYEDKMRKKYSDAKVDDLLFVFPSSEVC